MHADIMAQKLDPERTTTFNLSNSRHNFNTHELTISAEASTLGVLSIAHSNVIDF
jgi:hypothetical protein